MQILFTQHNRIAMTLKSQLKDFGLDPKDWKIMIQGFQIKVISKDSPAPIEFKGQLKTVFLGPFPTLRIENLELLSF